MRGGKGASTVQHLSSAFLSAGINKETDVKTAEWNSFTVIYANVFVIGFLDEKVAKGENYSDCSRKGQILCHN